MNFPATEEAASSCAPLSAVGYVIGAGVAQVIVGVAFLTTCATVPDDDAKSAEPEYLAMTTSVPTGSVEVLHVAVWDAPSVTSVTDAQPLMAAPLE